MKRSEFLKTSLIAGATVVSGTAIATKMKAENTFEGKTFHLNYAPHDGMFANHAGKDFLDQIRYMHDQGFRAIEDNGMLTRPKEQQDKIGDLLSKLGMTMGVFVIDAGDNWKVSLTSGKKDFVNTFVDVCKRSVELAKRINAKWATVVPGYFDRNLPIGIQSGNVIDALRRGAEVLEPSGLIMVLEPLSDNPDLFMRTSDQAYSLCRAINSPSCKILFDMYHMQRNEGNLIVNIDIAWEEIAYLQIGDNPGRNEPTSGEMNYKNIFKHLHEKNYKGVLGMEHGNSIKGKDGELALIKAYRESDNFE